MTESKQSPLKKLQTAYRLTIGNEMGKDVLADLRIFCDATKTTYSGDVNQMLINEGKRQVFYRIMTMLKVDFEDVYDFNPTEDY